MRPSQPPRSTRPAAQAGRFYPAAADALRAAIHQMLAAVDTPPPSTDARPAARLLVVPHAGYMYSGAVAAAAYAGIQGQATHGVLVLAPSHAGAQGAVLPTATHFETPLGAIELDRPLINRLLAEAGCRHDDGAHEEEHAIEVQLPWLQETLATGWRLVPLLLGRIGRPALDALAAALDGLLCDEAAAGRRWLVVISTDTYHGYDQAACAGNDRQLAALLEAGDPDRLWKALETRTVQACGAAGLYVALGLLRRWGLAPPRIVARSDSAAARPRGAGGYCVGYLAAVAASLGPPEGTAEDMPGDNENAARHDSP